LIVVTAPLPPSPGPHFGGFRVLQDPGLSPPPARALALLHRLAADPAIAGVMRARGWQVGLLAEMPPEGLVGVSPVCILGYNTNAGQSIHLRLRTDDWSGFRKYLKIRETLVHELAHNVFSEHDANFKQLNSELLREVAAREAAAGAGGHMLAAAAAGWEDGEESDGAEEGGRAPAGVRLGGSSPPLAGMGAAGVRLAAAGAALLRQQEEERRKLGDAEAAAAANAAANAAAAAAAAAAGAGAGAGGNSGVASADGSGGSDAEDAGSARAEQDAGHFNSATEEKERLMAALGSLDGEDGEADNAQARPQLPDHVLQPNAHQAQEPKQPSPGLHEQSPLPRSPSPVMPPPPPPQRPPPTIQQPTGEAAAERPDDPLLSGLDSAAAGKLAEARAALGALRAETAAAGEPGAAEVALAALARALSNVVSAPGNEGFHSLRLTNAAVSRKLARWPAARRLLQLAGFEERRGALLWVRRDPGLAWLALAAVQDASGQ
jgi:hypothetical protein